MTIPKVQLVMLPLSKWKVARVIRFRFKHHLCDCGGTIVYILVLLRQHTTRIP